MKYRGGIWTHVPFGESALNFRLGPLVYTKKSTDKANHVTQQSCNYRNMLYFEVVQLQKKKYSIKIAYFHHVMFESGAQNIFFVCFCSRSFL